jgi:hypothetical protein
MLRHKPRHTPWKFYYCEFTDTKGRRRFTYVGAANRIEVMDILFDLNGYLVDINITLLGLWLLKNKKDGGETK